MIAAAPLTKAEYWALAEAVALYDSELENAENKRQAGAKIKRQTLLRAWAKVQTFQQAGRSRNVHIRGNNLQENAG